ncbi:MAG TPA: hypothetical protein VJ746_06405 [Nitrospira sp.]|nr:hypothetical protein [Nitrospira sp.]
MTTTTLDDPLTPSSENASEAVAEPADSESTAETTRPSDISPADDATAGPAPEPSSTASASTDDDDDDDDDPILSLERDANDFEKATITMVLTLLPQDGHADGRLVLLGVKSHNLPPLTVTRRFAQLTPLPKDLEQLLMQWQHHYQEALAARMNKRAADKAKEKAKEEERKRNQEEARHNARTKTAGQTPTRTTAKSASTPAARPAVPVASAAAVPQSSLF